jgi:hypothetical protein
MNQTPLPILLIMYSTLCIKIPVFVKSHPIVSLVFFIKIIKFHLFSSNDIYEFYDSSHILDFNICDSR